jgi:hypothetical protein
MMKACYPISADEGEAQMSSNNLFKTGEEAPRTGRYEFVRYTDGTTTPSPTAEERIIYLSRGETFPPIRSTNKAAWWRAI